MAEATLGASDQSQGPVSVSTSSIQAQLERILASPDFNVPERARTFLKYIVTETGSRPTPLLLKYSGGTRLSIRSQIRLCVLKLVAFGARWKGIT